MSDLNKAMDKIAKLEDKDKITVKGGKKYTQVVTRVEMFRREFGFNYGISTEITEFAGGIMARATIFSASEYGRGVKDIVGSGHAWAAMINKEKCIERLETTAIGRALASIGLSGGEYCSQNELDTYEERYEQPTQEQKERQLEAIDGLYNLSTLDALDKYVESIDITSLPDVLRDTFHNQKDVISQQLGVGVIPECPGFRFIGVDHAKRWGATVEETINGFDKQFEIDSWIEINQRRLDSVATMLNAKKDIKDGKSPADRLQALIDKRRLDIEKGVAA